MISVIFGLVRFCELESISSTVENSVAPLCGLTETAVWRHCSGVEINARPLARGEWKPRGMSRIFAEVVRRASFFFFFFFFFFF